MAAVRSNELTIARGEGCWVWDADGRRYLDATASLWYANVGHGRPEIAAAIAAQLGEIAAYSTFGDLVNEPARAVAERIAQLAPTPGSRVFLGSGGGDGIETAVKLARLYWQTQSAPERVHVIGRTNGYHGTHGYGTSLAGIEANRAGYGPTVPGVSRVQWDSPAALSDEIASLGHTVAAFVVEPVIGAGGVYPPPPGYLEEVAAICSAAGVLLIADCTICGFGRLGGWMGVERWGLEPDMIVFAKGVTSGYLPLGGVVVAPSVAAPFWERSDSPAFRHGATYSGHATCCAAALANIDILESEGLIARGAALERELLDALAPLADHPLVSEVRGGTGLMAAVELDAGALARSPGAVFEVYRAARDAGVLVRPLVSSVAVSPPLIVTSEQLALIPEAIRAGLAALERGAPPAQQIPTRGAA
jgi:adenosylmethionine-8-amino-7-oxononanoate aminotransferase